MKTFYIHDRTRGYVGNSMIWWRKGHQGYTCDIREAHVFTEDAARECVEDADDLIAYPCAYIDERVSHHVDMQSVVVSECDAIRNSV